MNTPTVCVIDTNWVLDLWVFQGPESTLLRQALEEQTVVWLQTLAMRDELARVLTYPAIQRRLLARNDLDANAVLAHVEHCAALVDPAPRAPVRCKDPDDQIFLDLAVRHQAHLLSKDKAVLSCRKRLQRYGVSVQTHWSGSK